MTNPFVQRGAEADDMSDSDSDRYLTFHREQWAALRAATPLTLNDDDLDQLRGIDANIDLEEVVAIFLPLTRLLNLYVGGGSHLHRETAAFLGSIAPKTPFVIGIAGSVAVGKSTFARVLQTLLSRWPDHPKVDLITTDGFLYPTATLEAKGLMGQKGFPESYDTRALLEFVRTIKSGQPVSAPIYDHNLYDIVPGEFVSVNQPDIVIVEGLNVLQVGTGNSEFVSDYFDFSIYLDAAESDIEAWYIQRFHTLRSSVFQNPDSFFRHFSELSDEDAETVARSFWADINAVNLRDNIAPTMSRAALVVRSGSDHGIDMVKLRKL